MISIEKFYLVLKENKKNFVKKNYGFILDSEFVKTCHEHAIIFFLPKSENTFLQKSQSIFQPYQKSCPWKRQNYNVIKTTFLMSKIVFIRVITQMCMFEKENHHIFLKTYSKDNTYIFSIFGEFLNSCLFWKFLSK